jgi:hypothetical protein
MATKTEIINKALTLIGAAPITNIDDDSNNARVMSRVYESSLRSVLGECKWNFATKRALLTASTYTFDWYDTGETYVYVKPSDMIRIFGLSSPSASYREEGDYIISDTQSLGVRYVYYNDIPSKYPAYFVDALVDRLASDIAFMIVNSSSLGDKYKNLYESVSLQKATMMNSQTGTQQTIQDDAWELSRYNDINVNA